jgi:prepilin-type N-terminal cleavage/methylation domain-containing protein
MRRRRGFTLTEVLVALVIFIVVMRLGGELFSSVVKEWHQNSVFADGAAKSDAVVDKLRRDVWGCDQIAVPDSQSVRLHDSNGEWIDWKFLADGTAVRTNGAGQTWRCEGVCAGWSVCADGDGLVVQDSSLPEPGRVALVSQVLLARKGS